MRILIVGAGALGGLYGTLLARAGHEVTVLARGVAVDTLRANGLTLESATFGSFSAPVTVIEDPAEAGETDLIFFAVKAYDLESTARQIAPLVREGVTVLTIQNGVEHPQKLADILGEAAVLPGVVIVSATVRTPGVVTHAGGPALIQLGDTGTPDPDRLERVADVFRSTGAPVETYPDIRPKLWTKFALICAMSGMSALTRLTIAQIFAVPASRQCYRDIMDEVVQVGRASGVDLPVETADTIMTNIEAQNLLNTRGSMAHDLMAGRRIEIDSLNGSVVRLGEQLGVSTPINRVITAALLPYKDGSPM